MCLMLYLGSRRVLAPRRNTHLALEPLAKEPADLREHVGRDHVYFIGSHSGCSCGFPHVGANENIPYYDGVFDDEGPERGDDLASVRELLQVVDESLEGESDCVLFPVWAGSEGEQPRGEICWRRKELSAERFLVTWQFRYTIVKE